MEREIAQFWKHVLALPFYLEHHHVDPVTAALNFLCSPAGQRVANKLIDLEEKLETLLGKTFSGHMHGIIAHVANHAVAEPIPGPATPPHTT